MLPQILLIRTVRHARSLRFGGLVYSDKRLLLMVAFSQASLLQYKCSFYKIAMQVWPRALTSAMAHWTICILWIGALSHVHLISHSSANTDEIAKWFLGKRQLWLHILFPWGIAPAFISFLNNFLHDWRTMNKVNNIFLFLFQTLTEAAKDICA